MKLSKDVKSKINSMEFYTEENFKTDALRYIKATKENRIFCIIKSVSRSGMSRDLKFIECQKGNNRYNFYNFYQFFISLGFNNSRSNNDSFKIAGCGMDMIFHTHYTIIHKLYRMKIIQQKTCDILCQITPQRF